MSCVKPLFAYRSDSVFTASGKGKIIFSDIVARYYFVNRKLPADGIMIPCGQCVNCRLERSRQWAMRCMHEASLHEDNVFITLTFSDEYLPYNRSLDVSIFQKFMKRLRKCFGEGIRFYHCGEYGERFGRPHYHALLFNHDFDDKDLIGADRGHRIYRSDVLERIWPFGRCVIGGVTFQSAAYCARYIMKKRLGKDAVDFYNGRKPEYTTMSRRPGIGKGWFEEFKDDVYPSDFCVVNGYKVRPPKYYDNIFELDYPDEFKTIKEKRIESLDDKDFLSIDRLSAIERKKELDIKKLIRSYEGGIEC